MAEWVAAVVGMVEAETADAAAVVVVGAVVDMVAKKVAWRWWE